MGEGVAGKSVREMRDAGLLSDEGRTARGPIPPHHREYVLNVMGAVEALKAGQAPAGASAIVLREAQEIMSGARPPYFLEPVRTAAKKAPEKKPEGSPVAAKKAAPAKAGVRPNQAQGRGWGVVKCVRCTAAMKPNSSGPVFCCLLCVGSRSPANDELYCCKECLGRHIAEQHQGRTRRAA